MKRNNKKKDILSFRLKNNHLKKRNQIENNNSDNIYSNTIHLFEEKNEIHKIKIFNPFRKKENDTSLKDYNDNINNKKSIDSNIAPLFLKKKTIQRKKTKKNNLQTSNISIKEKKKIKNKRKRKKKEVKSKELTFFLINKFCSNSLKKEDMISLYALMILRESDKLKKNIFSFHFISNNNKLKIISNYYKIKEKELIQFQNYINNHNISLNLEIIYNLEKENLYFCFKEISKIYNDNILNNKLICLYCFQYFGDLKKHYFLKWGLGIGPNPQSPIPKIR